MKNKFLICSLISMMFSTAHALPSFKPDKCPSVDAIKMSQFVVEQGADQLWFAYSEANSYGREQTWSLLVNNVSATTETDAVNKIKTALQTSQVDGGPKRAMLPDAPAMWYCSYTNSSGYNVVMVMH